jgi:hypothetical protein
MRGFRSIGPEAFVPGPQDAPEQAALPPDRPANRESLGVPIARGHRYLDPLGDRASVSRGRACGALLLASVGAFPEEGDHRKVTIAKTTSTQKVACALSPRARQTPPINATANAPPKNRASAPTSGCPPGAAVSRGTGPVGSAMACRVPSSGAWDGTCAASRTGSGPRAWGPSIASSSSSPSEARISSGVEVGTG